MEPTMTTLRIGRRPLLVAALATSLAPRAKAQAFRDVTVAVSSTSFALGGVRIGQNAGLFEKQGLKLNIVVMDSGSATMSALMSRSAPFVVAGIGEMLAARARGLDIVLVANLYHNYAGWVVLSKAAAARLPVKPDAPQRDRLKALEGLVIAVPSATSALLAPIRSAAIDAGATVRFTYMAQPAMVAALETGAIDGLVAAFPFAAKPVLKGTGVLWVDGVRGDLPPASLPASSSAMLSTAEYVAADPDMVARMQRVLADIGTFIRQHPDAALVALRKGYPDLGADEVALAFEKQADNWTVPFLSPDDLRQELRLLRMSVDLPGLATLDPTKAIVPAP
jgi:ABC-type nitrate/sulfonate/bicarbonate transport system substrate-binding protein